MRHQIEVFLKCNCYESIDCTILVFKIKVTRGHDFALVKGRVDWMQFSQGTIIEWNTGRLSTDYIDIVGAAWRDY